MLVQFLMGLGFIVLPLAFTFGLPLIQEYFSKDIAFNAALDECESLFVEEVNHNMK